MQKIRVTIKIRNLCMNNSDEALILSNEGYQGLLKLHVHLLGEVEVGVKVSIIGEKKGLCYVALLEGSPVSVGFHYGNLVFGI